MSSPLLPGKRRTIALVERDGNGKGEEESSRQDAINCHRRTSIAPTTTTDQKRPSSQINWTRKNSVSLPAGLDSIMSEPPEYDPRLTPENEDYDTSDTFSDLADTSDNESCHIGNEKSSRPIRVPHRTARRKSVMPLRISDYSPENSVASGTSIASLLKEKIVGIPSTIRKKNSSEFRIKVFVVFLFLLIIFTITFAHIYYNQHIRQREYFPYTRFNKDARYMKLYSKEGVEIALGHLGVDLPDTDRVYDCRPPKNGNETGDGSLCFEWMDHARIRLSYEHRQDIMHCYNVRWYSLSDSINPTDCFEDGYQYGHWYGGGRTLGMAWPVDLGRVEMSPFVTGHIGRHRWGSVLKRYFINSKGVAITVDQQSPLYVSINAGRESRLCLKGRRDQFAYITSTGRPTLNYTICSSSNMKMLHQALSDKSLWDGLKPSDSEAINSLLTEPVWQISPREKRFLTDPLVVNYTEDVISLGFLKQGHVLLNEFWQLEVGDFTFDPFRFSKIKETIDVIRRRGFRLILTIQPFISTQSAHFEEAVKRRLLVHERGHEESRKIPALTRYKSLLSAGMLDITNNETKFWLQNKLRNLFAHYNVDALNLDLGSAYDIPLFYEFEQNLTNPDHYKAIFTECANNVVPVLGVSSAISRPPAPIFLSLPSLQSTWESLQVIIPTTLTYGIVGYPFLMPGPIGGDFAKETGFGRSVAKNVSEIFEDEESSHELPDKELYIRWMQLASFLPVVRYSHLPSYYDSEVVELAKNLTVLRETTVNPLLKKYVQDALETGIPLIRPLWMLDPSDSICHMVKDEFSIGDQLIVAPILRPHSVEREVYLPAGVWKDGIDGSLRKGSRWIHNYKASLTQVAYFVKMPQNVRF